MLSVKNPMEFLFANRSQLSLKGISIQPREFTQARRQKAEVYRKKMHRIPDVVGEIGTYVWIIGLLTQLNEPGVVAWEDVEEWLKQPEVLAFFKDSTHGQDCETKSVGSFIELQTESSGRIIIQSDKTKTNELQGNKRDPKEVEYLSQLPKQNGTVNAPQPHEVAITSMDASIKVTPLAPVAAHPQRYHRLNINVPPSGNSAYIRGHSSSRKASTGTSQPPNDSNIPTSSKTTTLAEIGKPEVDNNNPEDMDVVFLCEKNLKRHTSKFKTGTGNFKKQTTGQSGGTQTIKRKYISQVGVHSTAASGQASGGIIKYRKSPSLFGSSSLTSVFEKKAQPQPSPFLYPANYSYNQHSYPTLSYGAYPDLSLGGIYPQPQFHTGYQPSLQYNMCSTSYFSGEQNNFGSSLQQSLPSFHSMLPPTAGMHFRSITSPMDEQRYYPFTPRRSEASSERGPQSSASSMFSPRLQ